MMVAAGALLVALGLLFVVGAGGQARRVVIGVVMLGIGAVLAGVGVRLYRQQDAVLPEQLRAEIFELARRRNGEVSEPDLEAALGRRAEAARDVLQSLVRDGEARRSAIEGTVYYTFPDLQPRLGVKRCDSCGAEYALSDERASCPSCGGRITTEVRRVAASSDETYSMDE
jgi:DNA-directed RNA polymerase subunit RPC12/RpoP